MASVFRRQVVVTGVGMVTPLGSSATTSWAALVQGASGLSALPADLVGDSTSGGPNGILSSRVGGLVKPEHYDEATGRTPGADPRRMARFTMLAMAAAEEAVLAAGLMPGVLGLGAYDPNLCGAAIGSGIGALDEIAAAGELLRVRGPGKLSPFFVPRVLANMGAGHVAIRHGLQGPSHSAATACATGAHAIGDALRLIRDGDADLMLAGASEACVSRLSVAGFGRLRALSTHFNAAPSEASRPFDARRDGFVVGEGAAVLVLEEESAALARGAPVLARLRACGLSCDAHHMTSPEPQGRGALAAMHAALRDANRGLSLGASRSSALGGDSSNSMGSSSDRSSGYGSDGSLARLAPWDVDYVNAHATSTPLGDAVEGHALDCFFGSLAGGIHHPSSSSSTSSSTTSRSTLPMVSSTKGATGHLLGAAGALEAAFTVLSLRHGLLPTTRNLDYAAVAALAASEAAVRAEGNAVSGSHSGAPSDGPSAEDEVAAAPVVSARWQHVPSLGNGESNSSKNSAFYAHSPALRPQVAMCNSFGFGGVNATLLFTVP